MESAAGERQCRENNDRRSVARAAITREPRELGLWEVAVKEARSTDHVNAS